MQVFLVNLQFSDQGLKPGSLQWEHGVLATGPPGKSLKCLALNDKFYIHSIKVNVLYYLYYNTFNMLTYLPD